MKNYGQYTLFIGLILGMVGLFFSAAFSPWGLLRWLVENNLITTYSWSVSLVGFFVCMVGVYLTIFSIKEYKTPDFLQFRHRRNAKMARKG